ncbi:MAG: prepilin-type N-terminal cleavage/methylation domain-containing protein [Lachnospiraceae bacterium]|nr:prepilin-type N-terminal cleavage/methylation domain-containing protein [Lachnospiraceae bacterium]
MKRPDMVKDNKGMTLVEVLVGFVILTIIMAGVYHLISFGSKMLYESTDITRGQQEFEEELYKNSPDASVAKKDGSLGATLSQGAYVLKPASSNAHTEIELFSAADSENKLYCYTYDGKFSDSFGIRVYGFEK